ncbi:MAG: hypothetical protein GTO63_28165, partial [Anaerolineae bacterium]|nr:hypothetical protein [Anaerolineae bacterium]NIN98616.1 hypothetical protein [Anaerolineae bacterium]NIQ81502.1 hypothetical protein [Anaerolineae bacterium]
RWKTVYWNPFVLGLAFMMPVDMALSMWVFNLFWKGQVMLSSHYGWSASTKGDLPYLEEQSFGAYMGIAVILLWLDR